MLSLYEMTKEEERLNQLIGLVESEDDNNAVIELMDELTSQIKNKASNIIKVNANTKSTIEAVKNEIARLQAYKKSLENKEAHFKNYIVACMEKLELTKIETELGTISLRKTQDKVIIENENLVPSEFIIQEIVYKIRKNEIKDAIKSGEIVKGCHLESGVTLNIK